MDKHQEYFKIAKLISLEISGEISKEDQRLLKDWLNSSVENRNIYNRIKNEGWYGDNLKEIEKYKIAKAWEEINPKIKTKSNVRKLSVNILKYAALLVGILALGYFGREILSHKSGEPAITTTNTIKPGTHKAILTLDDGSEVILEHGEKFKSQNSESDGSEIIYKSENHSTSSIAFNYLSVPRGGKFSMLLADGTKVWLNSESKLKYPVDFEEGETRNVELIYGEAYFEVSPASQNNNSKFIVKTQNQEVEVLGTEFNIKAYREDRLILTTLLEGEVAVNTANNSQKLLPNQQSILNLNSNKLAVQQVDARSEVAWKRGVFSFKSKSLKEIVKILSRWYDVDFVFARPEMENIKFNGVLKKDQKIEKILKIIEDTKFINSYEIKDKSILLK